ncbi:hypothetical protein RRG08_048670 [Elysia crispata]|uniref:Uncharacterized protein n=1 Tax=Elysia crispata TaxID=231223 RepID=A0AAE1DWE6_9GAST|nr:hypothetical protein RRG08_048670 [Elysia crispata]
MLVLVLSSSRDRAMGKKRVGLEFGRCQLLRVRNDDWVVVLLGIKVDFAPVKNRPGSADAPIQRQKKKI